MPDETAYIYTGGFSGISLPSNSQDTIDAGLQAQPGHAPIPDYALFARDHSVQINKGCQSPCDPNFLAMDGFVPNSNVDVIFEIVASGSPPQNMLVVSGSGTGLDGRPIILTLMSVAQVNMLNGGWNPAGNGMVIKRITSIAWPISHNSMHSFTEGSLFGPVAWNEASLGTNGAIMSSWTSGGGAQCYPNDTDKIIVNNFTLTGERDKIDLVPATGGPCTF